MIEPKDDEKYIDNIPKLASKTDYTISPHPEVSEWMKDRIQDLIDGSDIEYDHIADDISAGHITFPLSLGICPEDGDEYYCHREHLIITDKKYYYLEYNKDIELPSYIYIALYDDKISPYSSLVAKLGYRLVKMMQPNDGSSAISFVFFKEPNDSKEDFIDKSIEKSLQNQRMFDMYSGGV